MDMPFVINLHHLAALLCWSILYALAVAVISWTIAKEEIFREVREVCEAFHEGEYVTLKWIQGPWYPYVPWTPLVLLEIMLRKLAYVPTCEFCTSFWVAAWFHWKVVPFGLGGSGWRGFVVAVFVLMGLANAIMSTYSRLRVEIHKDKAIAERVNDGGKSEGSDHLHGWCLSKKEPDGLG